MKQKYVPITLKLTFNFIVLGFFKIFIIINCCGDRKLNLNQRFRLSNIYFDIIIFKILKDTQSICRFSNENLSICRPKTGDIHFEFYSRKSDQKIVQDLLNHMIANGSLPGPGPIPLVKTSLSFQQEPALWLSVRT